MNISVLISGRGSNLQSLIDAQLAGQLSARIVSVISNNEKAPGLKRAIKANIPFAVIDHTKCRTREEFDAILHDKLVAAKIDLVCLAGFMRLLTDQFVESWRDRLINIHPSLLPSFKGLNTHERALKSGVRFSGCTTHYVRPAMDSGPIIAQGIVPILPGDNPVTLAKRVLIAEHRLYPATVRMAAEGKLAVINELVHFKDASFSETLIVSPEL
ncbi:MAG: phosphoribosylglycinamide formyltransferase [Pseudomonadota bacterium]|nr:phosphoribosylglycinamide formyltransferase [Pseudomonadota bacterium]